MSAKKEKTDTDIIVTGDVSQVEKDVSLAVDFDDFEDQFEIIDERLAGLEERMEQAIALLEKIAQKL